MKKYYLLFSFLVSFLKISSFGDTTKPNEEFTHQMIVVQKPDQKVWLVENPSNYQGNYWAEDGAGNGAIHLWSYYDDKLKDIRFAGCIIMAEDVAVEPKIIKFRDLKYSTQSGTITNGTITFKPLEIKISPDKWSKGVVFNSVFYGIKNMTQP